MQNSSPLTYSQVYDLLSLLLQQERVMRWGHSDKTPQQLKQLCESVLSHVGGMHIIALVLREMKLDEMALIDWVTVSNQVSVHDLPEIICGDKFSKSPEDLVLENNAEKTVVNQLRRFGRVGHAIIGSLDLYSEKNQNGAKNSQVARLVKSIDEIHGLMKLLMSDRADFNYKDHEAGRGEKVFAMHTYSDFPWLYGFGMYLVKMRTDRYQQNR